MSALRVRVSLVREDPGGYGPEVASPGAAGRWVAQLAREHGLDDGREHFGVALLDARHRVIGWDIVSVGALTATLVHPREVFRLAFAAPTAALFVWHTHPSGDVEPSAEDIALTRRLAAAGTLLGVEVMDHIVVGCGSWRWVSLKERGWPWDVRP